MFEETGAEREAGATYKLLSAVPGYELAGLRGLLRWQLRADELEGARATLDELIERADAAARAELRSLRAQLTALSEGEARAEFDFAWPLDPRWRIENPLAARLDPASQMLYVYPYAKFDIASYPLRRDGGPLDVEIELEPSALETGATVSLLLIPETGGEPAVELRVAAAIGKRAARSLRLSCRAAGLDAHLSAEHDNASSDARRRRRIRVSMIGSPVDERHCLMDSGEGEERRARASQDRGGLPAPGDYRLVLRSESRTQYGAKIGIRSIRVVGMSPRPQPSELDREALGHDAALVEGSPREVLEALRGPRDDDPRLAALTVEKLVALGRYDEAADVLAPMLAIDGVSYFDVSQEVLVLLRRQPAVIAPLLREQLGPRYPLFVALGLDSLDREVAENRRVLAQLVEDIPPYNPPTHKSTLPYLGLHPDEVLLQWRAQLNRATKRLDEARVDYEELTRRLGARGVPTGIDYVGFAKLLLERGELEYAREVVASQLTATPRDLATYDMMRASPKLRPLVDALEGAPVRERSRERP